MKYLKITNKGLLDSRLISLMGATTKREDETKIGEFGTGLKYSLAYFLQHNIDFKIFIGNDEIKVTTVKENIGEHSFEVVYVNGKQTSITTSMCHGWKNWYAIREIYCNALDEGEATYEISEEINPESDKTCFYIQLLPEIKEVYDNWHKYFSVGREAKYKGLNCKIYAGDANELIVYRNGIRVYYSDKTPCCFHYDFNFIEINEMREIKNTYALNFKISEALLTLKDTEALEYYLANVAGTFEAKIDYDYSWVEPSKNWYEALGDAKIIGAEYAKEAREMISESNIVLVEVPETLYKKLSREHKNVSALYISDSLHTYIEFKDEILDNRLVEAIQLLKESGYIFVDGVKFKTVAFVGHKILGTIHKEEKEIVLSEKLREMGLFELCTTLIEENEHLRTNYRDKTLEFQQHFINLYATELLKGQKQLV